MAKKTKKTIRRECVLSSFERVINDVGAITLDKPQKWRGGLGRGEHCAAYIPFQVNDILPFLITTLGPVATLI